MEYQTQFERLLSRAGKLTPAQQVGCFVSSLRENFRVDVQATRQATLSSVVGMARLYEGSSLAQCQATTPETRKVASAPVVTSTHTILPAIKIPTPEQIQELLNKGIPKSFEMLAFILGTILLLKKREYFFLFTFCPNSEQYFSIKAS